MKTIITANEFKSLENFTVKLLEEGNTILDKLGAPMEEGKPLIDILKESKDRKVTVAENGDVIIETDEEIFVDAIEFYTDIIPEVMSAITAIAESIGGIKAKFGTFALKMVTKMMKRNLN